MSFAPATGYAADPFSAVPLESGLYEDVATLVHDGLIYGFNDKTFDKQHVLSRYEMAIFTGKALSSYKTASPADQAIIKRLAGQFQSELIKMGATNVPGAQGKSKNKKKKQQPQTNTAKGFGNLKINGRVQQMWDYYHRRYPNQHEYGRRYYTSGHEDKYHDLEFTPWLTADLGGGWKGRINFYAGKDRGGSYRAQNNVSGKFDITEAYLTGPLNKRVNVALGRMCNATYKSIAMGEHWTGARWSQKINKHLTMNFTYGKPDYNKPDYIYRVNMNAVPTQRTTTKVYDDGSKKVTIETIQSDYSSTAKVYTYAPGSDTPTKIQDSTGKGAGSYKLLDHSYYLDAQKGYQLTYSGTPVKPNENNEVSTQPQGYKTGSDSMGNYSQTYVDTYKLDGISYFTFRDSRSVADTFVNPANVGIDFGAVEANYRFSNKWLMNLGVWRTHSNKVDPNTRQEANKLGDKNNRYRTLYEGGQKYRDTKVGEVQFVWQPTHKWRASLNLTRSDRDEQNTGAALVVNYGRHNVYVPHTWSTSFNFGRIGREGYVRCGYDMSNDQNGARGMELYYYYVPRKNFLMTFRYLLSEPLDIHPLDDRKDEEFRGMLSWFF